MTLLSFHLWKRSRAWTAWRATKIQRTKRAQSSRSTRRNLARWTSCKVKWTRWWRWWRSWCSQSLSSIRHCKKNWRLITEVTLRGQESTHLSCPLQRARKSLSYPIQRRMIWRIATEMHSHPREVPGKSIQSVSQNKAIAKIRVSILVQSLVQVLEP